MKTAIHLGMVAGLVGVCLAFAPTDFPSPRLFSSPFAPNIARPYPNLSPVENFRGSPICSLGNDVEDADDTEKEKWNEITPELRQAGENFCRVTGVDPNEIKILFDTLEELDRLEAPLECPKFFKQCIALLMPWKSIKRGKDLFITRMGTFDINKAYQCTVEKRSHNFERQFIDKANKCSFFDASAQIEGEVGDAKQRQIVLERTGHGDKKESMLRFRLGSHSSSWWQGTYIYRPYWLIFPLELQCGGYFGLSAGDFQPDDEDDYLYFSDNPRPDVYVLSGMDMTINCWDSRGRFSSVHEAIGFLLSQSEEYPQRQYLTKYYQDYFKQPRWQGYLDELLQCGSRHPDDGQVYLVPEQDLILNVYRKAWPLNQSANEVGPPPQLFNRIRKFRDEWNEQKLLAENVVYEHLNDLEDWETNGIRLVVLRSKYEIYEVGKELRNCALDYASFVAGKRGVLIKAVREDGRAVALGLFDLKAFVYSQIYGPRNEPVDEKTFEAYLSYITIIRKWY